MAAVVAHVDLLALAIVWVSRIVGKRLIPRAQSKFKRLIKTALREEDYVPSSLGG